VPTYLRPSADIYPEALLPGDPGRAMALAQELLGRPKMSNHARGLWGYCGETAKGHRLTIQSTGIGGPSAAAVLGELAELGVRRAVRVGTCEAIVPELAPGELIAVREVVGSDGVSRELGAESPLAPDRELGAAVEAAAAGVGGRPGTVTNSDLPGGLGAAPRPPGVVAVDSATAALLALGPRVGVAVASLLVVGETAQGRIDDEALAAASLRAGRAAVAALFT
jgi:uridine phosphorylase